MPFILLEIEEKLKKKKQNTWQQGSTNSATLKALIEFSKIFMVEYKELLSCLVISNVDSAVLGPYKLPFNTFPKSVLFFFKSSGTRNKAFPRAKTSHNITELKA